MPPLTSTSLAVFLIRSLPAHLGLGTVWLPLPHLLMMPFLISNKMWQSGIGGSIPSMIAYVFGVVGIFRLVVKALHADPRTRSVARWGAWVAAFVYGFNPNLIYMQATALTETLYLAFFIWTLVYFAEFLRSLQPEANRPTRSHGDALCASAPIALVVQNSPATTAGSSQA